MDAKSDSPVSLLDPPTRGRRRRWTNLFRIHNSFVGPSGKVDKRWILGGGAIVSFRKRQIFDRGGKVLS